jgi:putative protease
MPTIDVKSFREKVIKNCVELIEAAKMNFENQNYPVSTFLAITAIEEISKILYVLKFLRFTGKPESLGEDFLVMARASERARKYVEKGNFKQARAELEKHRKKLLSQFTPVNVDIKELKHLLRSRPSRSHVIRQQLGILSSLSINARAYRKLGPATIKKYIEMAKTGKLFDLRNRCLYIDFLGNNLLAPSETITRNDTLEIVCVAMEVVAELSDFGSAYLGDEYSQKMTGRWQAFLREADKFEKKHNVVPKKKVGIITNYLSRIGVAIVELTDDLNLNDEVAIEGSKTSFMQKVTSIEINHKKVNSAKTGSLIGMKVDKTVRRNDVVYKIIRN